MTEDLKSIIDALFDAMECNRRLRRLEASGELHRGHEALVEGARAWLHYNDLVKQTDELSSLPEEDLVRFRRVVGG